MTAERDLLRPLAAEAIGTGLLMASIVGSGIVVSTSGGDPASQLFQHAVVVGAALATLITVLGPISGAHFNPAVSIAFGLARRMPAPVVAAYTGAQVVGGIAGTALTNALFGETALAIATTRRDGVAMAASELLATAGLLLVIFTLVRGRRMEPIPAAVGAYIAAAIMFTSSDAFANPAVTLSRAFTDTWTGIAPSSVPLFLLGQLVAVVLAVTLTTWLVPERHTPAARGHEETRR